MHLGNKKQVDSGAVPLQSEVVGVEGESVPDGRSDECPLCGSRSLLGIAQMLGNTLPLHKASSPTTAENIVRFDLEFTIELKQMELKDLNAAIQHINSLIGARLVRGRARCHINVEPVVAGSDADEVEAA
jgi:hypothetical protein